MTSSCSAWIVATIVGFWLFWPVGLAILAFLAWTGRFRSWRNDAPGRWHNMDGSASGGCGWKRRQRYAAPSGNKAFDDYRAETLRRLEEEQKEFVDYLERLRQAKDKAVLPVGRRVVVIGGGNTAIDIAIQTKKLGAEDVTIVYRRGPETMSATGHEQELAQVSGVKIKHWARPILLIGKDGVLAGVEFEYTRMGSDGKLSGTGEKFRLDCDQLFKAIGQTLTPPEGLATAKGKIVVDGDFKTSMAKVWAGGDCIASGTDLTVQSVQDGKLAAHAIDRALRANGGVRG